MDVVRGRGGVHVFLGTRSIPKPSAPPWGRREALRGLRLHAGNAVAVGAGQSAVAVSVAAADAKENVWEAFNCEEKLHFVCY